MNKLTTVILAANGPVSSPRTWSNVPACLLKAFQANNINVVTVDISPSRILKLFYLLFCALARKRRVGTSYDYFRSRPHQFYVRLRLRLATLWLRSEIPLIVLSFSFPIQFKQRRVILLSDWTYQYYIETHLERTPDHAEASAVQRENSALAAAHLVISIFPGIAEKMKKSFPEANIDYLGHGVNYVSSFPSHKFTFPLQYCANTELNARKKAPDNREKQNYQTILFVGGQRYRAALRLLLNTFHLMQHNGHFNYRLDVVGFDQYSLQKISGINCQGITAYGYLDKANYAQYLLYKQIFSRATVFVNVSPIWVGFSSTLEALKAGIPVVVSPNDEIKRLLPVPSPSLTFCDYDPSPEGIYSLSQAILSLLNCSNYADISKAATKSVANFSWNIVVEKLINRIEHSA